MRSMRGADAGCLAINYQSLLQGVFSLLFFITLGLELSDTKVYGP